MPDTTAQPIALHFRGAAEAGAPRLAGLPGVHRDEPGPIEVREVERYDTDDLRLAAAGITLALHRGDGPAHGGSARGGRPSGTSTCPTATTTSACGCRSRPTPPSPPRYPTRSTS
ncbi:hypothetical protein ACVGOW_09295 [Pseudonocardia saturnea]